MMTYVLLGGLVALVFLRWAGRNEPRLQLVALVVGVLVCALGAYHAYHAWFANDLATSAYHEQIGSRQVLLGKQMGEDLGRSKKWKEAIFFEDVTHTFSADMVRGLKKGWPSDRPLHIYQGDSPSFLESPVDFAFRSDDVKAALAQNRNADLLVFSGSVPAGTQGRRLAILNVPMGRLGMVKKNTLVLAAASDRSPMERPSVQKQQLGTPEEEFEFFLREP